MPENKKTFQCDGCGCKEFEITIEPRYPATEEGEQWLEYATHCPVCGGDLEEAQRQPDSTESEQGGE